MDMLDKKLNHIFKWWDQNGDGYVTEDDVERMITIFTSLADENDQKNKETMREGLLNWWRLLLAGREDKTSEKLGKQEFITSMKTNVIADFETTIGSVVDGMLGALDKDGNGVLSQEEYLEMYRRLHQPESAGIEAFKKLDRNHNGEISHQELQQAMVEFYTSPDPDAPGQWLVGPPHDLE